MRQGRYLFSPSDEFKDLDLSDFPSIVDSFERRIRGWFLNPIEPMLEDNNSLFAATAVECLLVETLSGFVKWTIGDTNREDFIRFLEEELKVNREVAEEFYIRFRCGILYQGNIKEKSCITDEIDIFLLQEDGVLFFNPKGFFELLCSYFDQYLAKLKLEEGLQVCFRNRFYHFFREKFDEDKWAVWLKGIRTYREDIRKSIETILKTPKGSRESDPNFGSDIEEILFKTIDTKNMHLIEKAVKEALAYCEPRINVTRVDVSVDDYFGEIHIDIDYLIKSTNEREEVTIVRGV